MELTIKNVLSMLIKFGNYNNLIALQNGIIYMKNLGYYNNLELVTGDENTGDKYDGKALLLDTNFHMYSKDTGDLIISGFAPNATFSLNREKNPVFCMFKYDYRNCINQEVDGKNLKLYYEFSAEQKTNMGDFGDYALLILNADEFFKRVKKSFINDGVSYYKDEIFYYEGNTLEHIKEINTDSRRIAFWKRSKYAYQQEYRLMAFETEVDDFLCINIGSIKDITKLIPVSELLDSSYVLECTLK